MCSARGIVSSLAALHLVAASPALATTTVVLPLGAGPDTVSLAPAWAHRSVDLGLVMDCTSDMVGELAALRAEFSSIAAQLSAAYPDFRVGIAEFEDWPCGTYGVPAAGDLPFRLVQRCTSNLSQVQIALNGLNVRNGGDVLESGYDALHYAVTGAAGAGCTFVPPFNPTMGYVAGVADGGGGGMGFRTGIATPVVALVTGAAFHDASDYSFGGPVGRVTALAELEASGYRLGALRTDPASATALAQLRELSVASSTVTPPAYGSSATLCETGLGGAGIAPVDGGCPDVFDVATSGLGISTALFAAVVNALDASPFALGFATEGTPVPPLGSSTDFVQSVSFVGGMNPAFAPTPTVSSGGAVLEGSYASGSSELRIVLENASTPSTATAQQYPIYVLTTAGGVPVTRDTIVVEIPALTAVPPGGPSSEFRLEPSSHNPFSREFVARLALPAAGRVVASVCDVTGRRIRSLADGVLPAGNHSIVWNGMRDDGAVSRPGVYFVHAAWQDRRRGLRAILIE